MYQTEITQICTNMHMLNRYQSDIDTNTCISAFKTEPRPISFWISIGYHTKQVTSHLSNHGWPSKTNVISLLIKQYTIEYTRTTISSPLAQLLSWSQATCIGIKGNVPTLRNLFVSIICKLTPLKHIYHIMKLTEQCTSKPPTSASLSYTGPTFMPSAKRSFMKCYLVNWNQHNGHFICAREKMPYNSRPYNSRLTLRGRRNFILKSC